MPSKSPAQHRLMEAVFHDLKVQKKTGIPKAVAKEYISSDNCDIKKYMDSVKAGTSTAIASAMMDALKKKAGK